MKRKSKEPESLKMLKEAFKVFDDKGDGKISAEAMKLSILHAGGCSMKDVKQMIEVLDSDRDGMIQLQDFHKIFIPYSSIQSNTNIADDSYCSIS